jgi:hypothetical protein
VFGHFCLDIKNDLVGNILALIPGSFELSYDAKDVEALFHFIRIPFDVFNNRLLCRFVQRVQGLVACEYAFGDRCVLSFKNIGKACVLSISTW